MQPVHVGIPLIWLASSKLQMISIFDVNNNRYRNQFLLVEKPNFYAFAFGRCLYQKRLTLKVYFYVFCIICIEHRFTFCDPFQTDLRGIFGSWPTSWGPLMIQTIWIWIWWTPIPPQAWLVALGRLPYVWLNMAWDSGVETSIQLFLFASFLSFSLPFPPIPQSPPPLAAGWPLLVLERRPQRVRSWGEMGVCDGLKKAAVLLCWRPTERLSPRHTKRRPPAVFLCQAAANSSSSPFAVTWAALQLPELWLVQENFSSFWRKSALSMPQHLRLVVDTFSKGWNIA